MKNFQKKNKQTSTTEMSIVYCQTNCYIGRIGTANNIIVINILKNTENGNGNGNHNKTQ